ncbi:hypothetical protein ACFU5P_27100 [Streptomyces sp. NPDC057433]|uniref:hypothetical protein n=1 Tax=Streptomyces sp. NPDC057433 TaxID=3346132 RepID=UPI00367EDC23
MRRTARALTLAAAVGAVLNVLVPAASAEPSAEVSPGSVAPGGTVTVSVSCDPTDGPPPQTLEATSAAFDGEVVELRKATGADEEESGPAYRGTADIQDVLAAEGTAGTREDEPFDEEIDEELDEVFHEDRDEGLDGDPNEELGGGTGGGAVGGDAENAENTENTENTEEAEGPASPADGAFDALTPEAFGALGAVGTEGGGSAWTVEGTCPAAPGGKGEPWSVTFTVVARHPGGSGVPSRAPSPSHPRKPSPSHKPSPSPCPPSEHAHCGGPTVPGGVHAGAGGGSTGSVPALVAGGLLVAGAFGAAAHRLHRARGTRTDR